MRINIEEVYNKYINDVYRYSLYKLKNKEDAEDVTSHAFNIFIEKSQQQVIKNPKLWLIGVARNLAYEKYRARSKETSNINLDDVAEVSESNDFNHLILSELKNLDGDDQELITLKLDQDLKFDQIAEITDQSVGATKMKYYRALEKLRTNIKKNLKYSLLLNLFFIGSVEAAFQGNKVTAGGEFVANIIGQLQNSLNITNIIMPSGIIPALSGLSLTAKVVLATIGIVTLGTVGGVVVLANNNVSNPSNGAGTQETSSSETTSSEQQVTETSSTSTSESAVGQTSSSAAATQSGAPAAQPSSQAAAPTICTFDSTHPDFNVHFSYHCELGTPIAEYRPSDLNPDVCGGDAMFKLYRVKFASLGLNLNFNDTCGGAGGGTLVDEYTVIAADGKNITVKVSSGYSSGKYWYYGIYLEQSPFRKTTFQAFPTDRTSFETYYNYILQSLSFSYNF